MFLIIMVMIRMSTEGALDDGFDDDGSDKLDDDGKNHKDGYNDVNSIITTGKQPNRQLRFSEGREKPGVSQEQAHCCRDKGRSSSSSSSLS